MGDLLKGLISSLIAAGLFEFLKWIGHKYSLAWNRWDPRMVPILHYILLIIWGVSGIIIHSYVIFFDITFIWIMPAYFIWSFLMLLYFINRRNRLWYVGIYGADKKIKEGIDYKTSLSLIKNEFIFLGIGASKLTDQKQEFEQAIQNCMQDRPVRLLLCKPTSEMLIDAANRFGKPVEEYNERVITSLRYISNLKSKYKNIQVRFYEKIPIFRMMFVDNSICLLSYNVTGEGDGSQLPQIHVVNKTRERAINSLYYSLMRYFKDLWEESYEWDFREFLSN